MNSILGIGNDGPDLNNPTASENSPVIILKKGKTEMRITNAVPIIKRINEMYPEENRCNWSLIGIKKAMSELEREKQKKWIIAARVWFKNEIFGGSEDFIVFVEEPKPKVEEDVEWQKRVDDKLKNPSSTPVQRTANEHVTESPGLSHTPKIEDQQNVIHSVNKNAYELRQMILENAMYVVSNNLKDVSLDQFVDSVMEVSDRFYSFVENKNRHNK